MIICTRPAHRMIIAQGWPIRMIICKRPAHPDNHLRKAGQSRWSFAKGRPIGMINCKTQAHPDDHWGEGTEGGEGGKGEEGGEERRKRRKVGKLPRTGRDRIEGSIRGHRRPWKVGRNWGLRDVSGLTSSCLLFLLNRNLYKVGSQLVFRHLLKNTSLS